MKKYRVVVVETQSYEVYVEANTEEEAEEIAEDTYGCDGDIFSTFVDVVHVEEES
jgi:CTP:phosphocholine cytidylyltransferase-like protein